MSAADGERVSRGVSVDISVHAAVLQLLVPRLSLRQRVPGYDSSPRRPPWRKQRHIAARQRAAIKQTGVFNNKKQRFARQPVF